PGPDGEVGQDRADRDDGCAPRRHVVAERQHAPILPQRVRLLASPAMPTTPRPRYVVLREVGDDLWQVVGEVDRRPGHTAKAARARAILDATGGVAKPREPYPSLLAI